MPLNGITVGQTITDPINQNDTNKQMSFNIVRYARVISDL